MKRLLNNKLKPRDPDLLHRTMKRDLKPPITEVPITLKKFGKHHSPSKEKLRKIENEK